MEGRVRVLLAEPQSLIRQGLRELFRYAPDFVIAAECRDCCGALAIAQESRPDIILLSVTRPTPQCKTTIQRIKQQFPQTRIVALVDLDSSDDFEEMTQWDVHGYLSKNSSASSLFKHLRDCLRGEVVVSHSVAACLIKQAPHDHAGLAPCCEDQLTAREWDIMRLLADGYTNKAIAAELNIAESTTKRHVHVILDKLGMENRVQAAVYAQRSNRIIGR